MTEKEAQARLMKKVGQRVSFKYPGAEGEKRGVLKDRVVVKSTEATHSGARFWNVIDLLDFSDATDPWIRFGYYRESGEHLIWARSSLADGQEDLRRLFVAAAKKAPWFRELVKGLTADPTLRA